MLDRYKSCLLGLAVGDALGAPVEFLSLNAIRAEYGRASITDFDSWDEFKPGSYTDDTQMSLATALGCIRARQQYRERGVFDAAAVVHRQYLEWLRSQSDPANWRAPGNTCISALESGKMGTIDRPINDSKGCGGVMRTAPVGLAFDTDQSFHLGAEFAAITHGHPSGYLPAGFLAEIISHICGGKTLREAIDTSKKTLVEYEGHEETLKSIDLALRLAGGSASVIEAIEQIGEGWVGEEALGIALFCSLRFSDNFKDGVIAAVNHSGDSDSTGSITGAILGTLLGVEAIPEQWIKKLENSSLISEIAEDLCKVCRGGENLSHKKYHLF
jgi:ADP-ribosylglycohydrolase